MYEALARFFASGGLFMWLILGVLATALAVIAERLHFYYRVCRADADDLVANAARALNRGDAGAARKALGSRTPPLNALLGIAMDRHLDGFSIAEVRQAVEERAIREVPRLSRRLGYLATFANVATLAGLLGTIYGLQQSFASLAVADAAEKAALLAAGISQAMNTTAFGLIVAIPCMIAHAKLSSRSADLLESLDVGTVRFLNYLANRRDPALSRNGADESAEFRRPVTPGDMRDAWAEELRS
jgi:biopolymer transport protein ExbB/TolQ